MLRFHHAAALFLLLVPACLGPTSGPAFSPLSPRARLALAPFVDETPKGAGPLAEGLRLLLQDAFAREPTLQLMHRPEERPDLLLRGTLLDFRPAGGQDSPVLVTELGLVDVRNGALVTSRIVTGSGAGGRGAGAALPGLLRHWAGTGTERMLRAWLASALVGLREGVPAGYFVYDASGNALRPLPPPPPMAGQRPGAPDVPSGMVTPTATVTAETAHVREGPGLRHPILGELYRGEVVQVLDERGEWSNVRMPGGLEGWVSRRVLTEPRAPLPGAQREEDPR